MPTITKKPTTSKKVAPTKKHSFLKSFGAISEGKISVDIKSRNSLWVR